MLFEEGTAAFAGTAYGRPRVAGQTGRAITGRHLFARTAAPHSAAADAVGRQSLRRMRRLMRAEGPKAEQSVALFESGRRAGNGPAQVGDQRRPSQSHSTWREDAPKLHCDATMSGAMLRQNAKVA